ncbi:465_t:CDS:2 [Dentiscutata erythropus]|uniref:465_t:CDS:1 n=1 Tax=Dentiscutata erythropus TaxID=1348616 RepID=A0A9N9FGI7_9GLOM|nr:465_t:CDS:2 [Dentiscutata erythropus]
MSLNTYLNDQRPNIFFNLGTMKFVFLVLINFYFLNTVQCGHQKIASACFTGKYEGITGTVTFTEKDSKIEVHVKITSGLNDTTGKYPYHVHDFAINSTGSCESAGEHLDPFGVGKVAGYVCNPQTPEKCEAGDLSGKHGPLPGTPSGSVTEKYTDRFISLSGTPTLQNGVIGRSLVLHTPHTELLVLTSSKENVGKRNEKEELVEIENC